MPRRLHIRAFTLIEMLVALSIFLLISLIILANYGKFNSSVLLGALGYDIGASIRQAQVYGISVKALSGGSNFQVAYGIDFSSASPTQYLLYADAASPLIYHYDTNQGGQAVNTYSLGLSHSLKQFCAVKADGTKDCSDGPAPPTYLDIEFVRPEPDAIFSTSKCVGTPTTPCYASAYVVVTSPSGETRTVHVYSTGQISVTNP
jgi:prepilin-type N-terminal cleavage/methylation domain-containing protein